MRIPFSMMSVSKAPAAPTNACNHKSPCCQSKREKEKKSDDSPCSCRPRSATAGAINLAVDRAHDSLIAAPAATMDNKFVDRAVAAPARAANARAGPRSLCVLCQWRI